jgi:peptidase C25-like protein
MDQQRVRMSEITRFASSRPAGVGSRPLHPAALALLLAAALAAGAPPARGASSGSSPLYTPQGNGAGTANGDYIASGINTFYRYFIEVPSGLSRLRVQLFDADIGMGADEQTEGTTVRDRKRAANYDTTATYSLIDPSGTARPTQFSTGSSTGPASSDNAWLSLYDGNGVNDVRDNFGSASYSNNDGSQNWAAAWIESDSPPTGTGPTAGGIQIVSGELRIGNGSGTPSLERQADLSATGLNLIQAFFSFSFRLSGLGNGETLAVQVSSNGGTSYTTLETLDKNSTGTTRDYNITSSIASNTRVRFLVSGGFTNNNRFIFFDNVRIHDGGALTAGHWELRVDESSATTTGTAINALGIRADDGDATSGGTELNVYYDSHNQYGINPPTSGTVSHTYAFYPYITSGCKAEENDFDYDSNSGTTGAMTFTSRSGAFTKSLASTDLSSNDVWKRNDLTGWVSDSDAVDYGLWSAAVEIDSYIVTGTENGNYANLYLTNDQAAANPPTANPSTNAFRVYLPTDAGAAPVEPYAEQFLRYGSGPGTNPPTVNQTTRFVVTVKVVNPTAQAITFSASNLVTANVPGSGATYAGSPVVSQGSIVAQPSVGGTGNITWNPGTLAAGATALLDYQVDVKPTSAGQRVVVTGTPASGNGTRAQYVDGTGNTTQSRATYLFGPLCELASKQGLATQAVVSSFTAHAEGGAVVVEWQTASEAGTAGFDLYRQDAKSGRWQKLNQGLLLGLLHAPQGGTYRFVDAGAATREAPVYRLVEVEMGGKRRQHGPYPVVVDWDRSGRSGSQPPRPETGYDRAAHPAARPAVPRDEMEPAVAEVSSNAPPARAIHVAVRESGLYYLKAEDIAPYFGLTPQAASAAIGSGKLSLTLRDQPVAWFADLDGGKKSKGLFFYGQAIDSIFTDSNVYRLDRGKGATMAAAAVATGAGAATDSFAASAHAEQDLLPATLVALDPESDYWFWDFVQSGDPTFGTKTFAFDAPGLAAAAGSATLVVHLQGATASGVTGEHHAAVRLNGTPLGEVRWQGVAAQDATFSVAQSALHETGNQVDVTGVLDGGTPFSIFYVDSFDLSYRRLYRAAGDALAFRGDGNPRLTVSGFTGATIRVLDLQDPQQPRWLTGATVDADPAAAGRYRVSFQPDAPQVPYLAAGPGSVKAASALRPWRDAGLRAADNRADYLVVTAPSLRAAAERLAAYRAGQGLETRVVDLDEVADEFNFGIASPHALQDFLVYAWHNWAKPPRYVALAGAGTFDYRDRLGFGGNLVPPLLVRGDGGLFGSDNLLADVAGGDGLPEMAIGRIPAHTAAELDAYTHKLMAYEGGAGDWPGNAVMLADAPDGGADFGADSERVAALLPSGYAVDRIYLGATPLPSARTQLLGDIGRGASLIDYLGHGALDRLAAGGLLANADAATLTNGDRLPVLTAMTCAVNRFTVPGVPALGELLVDAPNGGAVAVWAPSGLSIHSQALLLAESFYQLNSVPGLDRLGDQILRSLRVFHGLGGDGSMLDIYNLLGDPALRLRRPTPPPATPGTSSGE